MMRRFIKAALAALAVSSVLAVGAHEAKADHFRHHGGYGYGHGRGHGYGYGYGFGRGGYYPPPRHCPPYRGIYEGTAQIGAKICSKALRYAP